MIKLVYPDKKPAIKIQDNRELIFCLVRKKWVLITPEEWVRQNFLLYLTEVLFYPASLIAVEKKISLGDISKRFDIVVYNNNAEPVILVECKEMNVPLNEEVLQQVLRYNINLQAACLVITNGSHCFAFRNNGGQFEALKNIPTF
jgi:hypothetical protein